MRKYVKSSAQTVAHLYWLIVQMEKYSQWLIIHHSIQQKEMNLEDPKLKNRAVYDLIEPGSTIKPMIIYSGLENNVIDQNTVISTSPGVIKIEDKEIKDWKYLGDLIPKDIIKYSSNIGAAKISKKLSKKQVLSTLNNFGLGQSLFLDLPDSQIGNLPVSTELSESSF